MPPTSAVVPGGAALCAVVRNGPDTVLEAASEFGSFFNITLKSATVPSGDTFGGATLSPTPDTPDNACEYASNRVLSSGLPSSERSITSVGCVTPAGRI